MTITFVTSNLGKVGTLKRELSGFGIEVEQVTLDIIEPQADTAEEIALSKARQAYKTLKRPLLVDDSSFHIHALNGFPGPYVRYAIDVLGIERLMTLLENIDDRTCHFENALVYMDENGEPHTFTSNNAKGRLAYEIDDTDHEHAWSDLWKIFIPGSSNKTMSAMNHAEFKSLEAEWAQGSAYIKLAKWLSERAA